MAETQNATVVRLTDTLREFHKIANFHEIPDEATHVAFFEDGDAAFLEGFEVTGGSFSDMLGKLMFISTQVHFDVPVEV